MSVKLYEAIAISELNNKKHFLNLKSYSRSPHILPTTTAQSFTASVLA